jgi:hypothetical protein
MIARVAHRLPERTLMTPNVRRAVVLVTILVLGACSGASKIFHGVIDDGPPATEAQVVAMLNFDAYVTDSYIRRQKLLASCENLRTFYNQVERSIHADLPDTSRYAVNIVAAQRTRLQSVTVSRSWARKGKIEASYRVAKDRTDSVEVSLWSSPNDRSPATWRLPRKGPVGLKLDALGKRALAVTCTRSTTR